MSLAEHTRQARVDVILDAAERLIRRGAGTQFSMRALAEEAGVSPATPFNLLGSKAKILEALFTRSFALPQRDQPGEFNPDRHNALDYSFAVCELVMQRYADDAVFYRCVLSALGASLDALLSGVANWQLVLQVAVHQGDLRPNTPVQSIAETIELGIAGTMGFWGAACMPSARLAPQARFAIGSALFAFATPSAQKRLQRLIASAARTLRAQGPLGREPEA